MIKRAGMLAVVANGMGGLPTHLQFIHSFSPLFSSQMAPTNKISDFCVYKYCRNPAEHVIRRNYDQYKAEADETLYPLA